MLKIILILPYIPAVDFEACYENNLKKSVHTNLSIMKYNLSWQHSLTPLLGRRGLERFSKASFTQVQMFCFVFHL